MEPGKRLPSHNLCQSTSNGLLPNSVAADLFLLPRLIGEGNLTTRKMPRRSGAFDLPLGSYLTTISAAVVALLVALLIRDAVGVSVLLAITISWAVVVVRVLVGLLLCRTEAVSGLAIMSTVIYAVGEAHLLRSVAAAVVSIAIAAVPVTAIPVSAVPGSISISVAIPVSVAVPVSVPAPAPVIAHLAVGAAVSGLVSRIIAVATSVLLRAVVGPVLLTVSHAVLVSAIV